MERLRPGLRFMQVDSHNSGVLSSEDASAAGNVAPIPLPVIRSGTGS